MSRHRLLLVCALAFACTSGEGDEASFTSVPTGEESAQEESEQSSTTADESESESEDTLESSTTDGCEDLDGDGWTTCEGDCCDAPGGVCTDFPELVNPGAFDVAGNSLDDDCDGTPDNPPEPCDADLMSFSQDADDYARAMDLCTFVEEDPADPVDRRWGVVETSLTLTDGSSMPHEAGHSIRTDFGDVLVPASTASLAVLSSGVAADATDVDPDFVSPQDGVNFGTGIGVSAPSDWLAANNDKFPNPLGCPDATNNEAHDAQMLTLRVRVPTNARSFTFRFSFFSAEYPEWVCSAFNDFFVALIDSEAPDNPADKNIAVYDDGATVFPVGINLVESANGLFTVCENGQTGCRGSLQSDYVDCDNTAALVGTGFDGEDGVCPTSTMGANGGGTGWLEVAGNVKGGEIMTLRLGVWDGSGHLFDSTVLLDNFVWSLDSASPGIYIP